MMTETTNAVRMLIALLLVSSYLSHGHASSDYLHCAAAHSSSVRFSINSRRNISGHWLTQVQLLHGQDGSEGVVNEEARPWDVDVSQNSIICEGQEMVNITVVLSSPPRRPSPSYELLPGIGYYKFHATPDTWLNARQRCSAEGGHLAIVNSEKEEGALKQLFAEHTTIAGATHNEFIFLGFHDRYSEGEYITIFGKPLSTTGYVHWLSGQPDNAGGNPGEDCGSFHRVGGLNDIPCDWKLAFICEQELW